MVCQSGLGLIKREDDSFVGFGVIQGLAPTVIQFYATEAKDPPEIHECTIIPPLFCDIVLSISEVFILSYSIIHEC